MNKKELLNYLEKQGFSDKIVNSFNKVKREDFISKEFHKSAYENTPLSIGKGQTISQPYTIAFMLTLLELKDNLKILEIGSGSGYVLALINEICSSKLYGIERIKELFDKSFQILNKKENIKLFYGDGSKGLKKEAPFDRILISASCNEIPQKIVNQLSYGGILVAPVRDSIIYLKKDYRENKIKEFPGFVFVPLIED